MQQEPDRRFSSSGEMKTAVETIRTTPLPQKPATGATTVPPPSGPGMIAPPPGTVQNPAQSGYAPVPKSTAHVGTMIAAGCAVIAVGMVLWKEFRPAPSKVAGNPDGTVAPQITPATPVPKTDPPIAEHTAPSTEQFGPPATFEQLVAASTSAAPMEKPREPVAPVANPPSDPPVAVAVVKTPLPQVPPRVTQLTPSQIPGSTRITPANPVPPPIVTPPAVETPLLPDDWRSFVASGDNLMRRRRSDEAVDAYAEALEVAQANPKNVSLAEYGRVCMSLSSLQLQNGSQPEARRTLIQGRLFLIKNKGPAGTISQMEEILKKLQKE